MIAVLVTAAAIGGTVALDDEEQHHLRVRRAAAGETVQLLDGAGLVAEGTLRYDGRRALVEVTAAETVAAPAPLVLAVAAGDRARFAWLAEKATELGVTRLVPLETERSLAVSTRLRQVHVARVGRRALEAVKQCGAAWATVVEAPIALDAFLRRPAPGGRWLADAGGSAPSPAQGGAPLTVVVGPEGGFTAGEIAELASAGFVPVRFGSHILRFETAALVAAAYVGIARTR